MADIQFNGNHISINGSITEKDVDYILTCTDPIEWIVFYGYEDSPENLKLLNRFFQSNPHVYMTYVGKDQLQYIPNVQNITFYQFEESLFDELKYVKHVNGIDLKSLKNKIDLSPLLAYKDTLTELYFEKDIKKTSEAVISQLTNLKKVGFISSKFSSFSFLKELPIESFFLYGSRTKDYADLALLSELKHFRLKTNTTWSDFDFLRKLTKLENIDIQYCSAITHFPQLDHLEHLNKVFVDGNKLEGVSELWKLKNCKVYATGKILIKNKTGIWMDNRPKKEIVSNVNKSHC